MTTGAMLLLPHLLAAATSGAYHILLTATGEVARRTLPGCRIRD